MFCAHCEGSDLRKLSLVYESGLSFTQSSMSGVGVGLGGPAIGVGKSKGTQISALAAKAAPPAKQRIGGYIAFTIVCLFLVAFSNWWWLGVAIGATIVFGTIRYNRITWRALFAQWDAQYMCNRCGSIGLPVTNLAPASRVVERANSQAISDSARGLPS
jgi:hypothetical protein